VQAGALIVALSPQTVTLEDLFFSLTEGGGESAAADSLSEDEAVGAAP
jgi:hypothetical protein